MPITCVTGGKIINALKEQQMDCSNAWTEPFCIYGKSHESLNHLVKIASASLELMARVVDQPKRIEELNKLVKFTTEPWGPLWPNNFVTLSEAATSYLSGLAVVDSLSAFDRFLTFTKGECDRWASIRGRSSGQGSWLDDNGDISLTTLYQLHNWSAESIEIYRSLFRFFQECRNCIVHRAGQANIGLCKLADSEELKDCISNWPFSRNNQHLPDLPEINSGAPIELAPKHAILSSATCYRIAADINRKVVAELSDDGVVYMAAFYSLIDDCHPSRLASHRSVEKPIVHFLRSRYRVPDATPEEVVASLKRSGVWDDVRKRFAEVYR